MDRHHSLNGVIGVMDLFLQKLIDIGYETSSREEIIKSGIRKYFRDLARAHREGKQCRRGKSGDSVCNYSSDR